MKRFALVLALLALLPAPRALAGGRCCSGFPTIIGACESPAHWARRHDTNAARLAITTSDGEAVLVLTDQVVAIQLTDKTLHRVTHELKVDCEDTDNALGHAIKTAVVGMISDLLDHCAECPIRDLRDVEYRDGELVFTTQEGQRVLGDFDVHDQNVMTGFSPEDARQFVKDFRRLKGRES